MCATTKYCKSSPGGSACSTVKKTNFAFALLLPPLLFLLYRPLLKVSYILAFSNGGVITKPPNEIIYYIYDIDFITKVKF